MAAERFKNNNPISGIMKKEVIMKYALHNAVQFNGKANPGAVVGKLIAEDPKVKSRLKKLSAEISSVVREVNLLSVEDQLYELKKIAPELLEEKKKEKKTGLKPLKDAKKVIMRFRPSPSGPLHIGHAYVLSLNSEYCRQYKGKLLLVIDDTNPKNIYEPAYKMIEQDARWLTNNNISKTFMPSSRLDIYYGYAKRLVSMGKAYVCTCDPDRFRKLIFDKKPCPCRNLPVEEQLERWNKMFNQYAEGEAVVRIKTDIKHKNPALRDWPALRINEHEHPKTRNRYRVWPLMNFSVAVDDIEMKVTHIIRAKDHMDNARKQEYIYDYLGEQPPETIFVGRINFTDLKVSSTETRKLIEYNKFSGWDDIRLPFLAALERRGYQPEAFVRYAVDVGTTQNDKSVSKQEYFKAIDAHNKELIDSKSNRYFFINNPVKIKITDSPEQFIKLKLHPDFPKRGNREFKTKSDFYIAKDDHRQFRANRLIRLMDCLNFKKTGSKFMFDSVDYAEYKKDGSAIIHWLPVQKDLIKTTIFMPDGKKLEGLSEPLTAKLKEDDIIQFERTGFCILDKKEKNRLEFWFAHR